MQHYLHLSNSSPDTPAHPDFWIRTLLNVNIISTDWANWLISTATTLFHGWLQVRQGRLISADGVLYPSNYHHYPTLSRTRLLRFRCLDFFTSTTCFFFNRWLYILILYLVCMHTQRCVCELYCFGVCVCVWAHPDFVYLRLTCVPRLLPPSPWNAALTRHLLFLVPSIALNHYLDFLLSASSGFRKWW